MDNMEDKGSLGSPTPRPSIKAYENSSHYSIRESIRIWRHLSAQRRASQAESMLSSQTNLTNYQASIPKNIRSSASSRRQSAVQELSVDNVEENKAQDVRRSNAPTRMSSVGTDLFYHEPVQLSSTKDT
ncbi:uncharacterized protein LOC111601125 isoform X1 [Drosophila hydei]|uniref:Uncharacterized protein LOC111601125 isoform X1 n=1 Tax=Drosophila hydei TaxID=7224 RepID=A0A6J1M2V9_DROHY|nr:uncharacterized protein LOC111601125 isoform X1 [Drosophila hydei]